jgi:hypothetical protein
MAMAIVGEAALMFAVAVIVCAAVRGFDRLP